MERLYHPLDARLITAPSGRRRLLVDLHGVDRRRFEQAIREMPRRPGIAWADWVWAAQRARTRPGWFVVETDIRRCYRSIRPFAVEAGLRAVSGGSAHRQAVTAFLDATSRAGIEGLPVGPLPSAVLADAVLTIGDLAVRGEGAVCMRWVDDVVIAGERSRVQRAYRAWRAVIEDLGLTEHDGKHREGATARPRSPSFAQTLPRAMMPRP